MNAQKIARIAPSRELSIGPSRDLPDHRNALENSVPQNSENNAKSPGNMGNSGGVNNPSRRVRKNKLEDHLHENNRPKSFSEWKRAFPRDFQSWKNGKSRCKTNGCSWDPAWDKFPDFMMSNLASIGPRPPGHTLDRTLNHVKEYGPGRCHWQPPLVQNNNKSDNLKWTLPSGLVLTPKKVAKMHRVTDATARKWFATYCPFELLAGKRSPELKAEWVRLDDILLAARAKPAPRPRHYPNRYFRNMKSLEAYERLQRLRENVGEFPTFEGRPLNRFEQMELRGRFNECDVDFDDLPEWAQKYVAPVFPPGPPGSDDECNPDD